MILIIALHIVNLTCIELPLFIALGIRFSFFLCAIDFTTYLRLDFNCRTMRLFLVWYFYFNVAFCLRIYVFSLGL